MSVNHHMHPRNIYKKPPNFVKLALEYPEFQKFVKQDLSGKVSVNFKEREAVLALTKALLDSDFGLSLTLPENRLVPTLPLRLNYILWLEDLLQLKQLARKEQVHGIDIGTGAACIYPLLAAKKNNWKMLATEVDGVSIQYANSNVTSNELTDLIKVEAVTSDSVLMDVIKDKTGDFDFCMCNPPFFASEAELQCRPERNPPRNAPTGCKSELVATGGEVAFVKRIIHESEQLGTKVRVYTTMLGKKTSLKELQTYLGEKGKQIVTLSVGTSEFCQGHTTRWGLAWSFLPGVVLPDLVKSRKKNEKKKNPAVATLKNCTLSSAVEKLNLLFKELEIHTKLIRENPSRVEMSITAMRNTWTHQRRKRRANKRQNKGSEADKDGDSDCKKSRLDSKYVEQVVGETSNSDGKLRLYSKYVEQVVGETSKVNAVSMREGVEVSEKLGSDSCLEKLGGKVGLISEKIGSFPEKEGSSNNLEESHVQIVPEKIETIKNSSQSITEQSSILSDVSKGKLKDSTQNGSGNPPDTSNIVEKDQVESDVVEKETDKISISSNDVSEVEKGKNNLSSPDENNGLDDYIGNKWADIDTLPLLTADLLIQNLGKDVMVAISLADGCVGGWEVVHQIRQTIINRVEL